MKQQVYNLENIRDRYGRLTYRDISDMGWTLIDNTVYNNSSGGGVVSCQSTTTEYILAEPEVDKWLLANNVKIRKSNVWFEDTA